MVKVGDSVAPQTVLTQVDESGRLEVSVGVPVDRADEAKVGETPMELLDDDGKPQLARAPVLRGLAPRSPHAAGGAARALSRTPGRLRSGSGCGPGWSGACSMP